MAKAAPIAHLIRRERPLRESSGVLLVRWDEVCVWAKAIHDPEKITELHAMRIAAKRLRYTLEIFLPSLDPAADTLLKIITELQERIGAIHDCDVLFPLLRRTMEQETRRESRGKGRRGVGPPSPFAAEGLVALIVRKRAERAKLYAEFLLWWEALTPERVGEDLKGIVHVAEDQS